MPNPAPEPAPENEKIEVIDVAEEMSRSFLDYSMSVIISRALPDARDGLKPSQRRILYAMHDLSLFPGRQHRKCAKICGDTSGNYHPHGEAVIYPTLVHMAQPWAMRAPLVDGQGNFGSVEGDPPAAMRYCVTADTLVVTGDGLVPIGELAPAGGGEEVALRVLSMQGAVQPASRWFDCGAFPVRRVRTRRGYELTGTPNHPLLVCVPGGADDGAAGAAPRLVWKTIAELRPGDFVALDRGDALWPAEPVDLRPFHPVLPPGSRVARHVLPDRLDEDLAFLLGAFLAEGTFRRTAVEFTNADEEFTAAFRAAWQRVFPTCRLHAFRRAPVSYGKKPFWQIQVVSQQVIAFLRRLGLQGRSAQRRLPGLVLRSPPPVAAAFLRAFYEGDGGVERSGTSLLRVGLTAKSRALLREVQTLLLRFGLTASLGEDRARGTHRLMVVGRDELRRFESAVGFVSGAKRAALAAALASYSGRALSQTDFVPHLASAVRAGAARGHREWLAKNNFDRPARLAAVAGLARAGYLFEPVAAVEEAGEQRVYSVRVDAPCHSFVANGFVNHNTEARLTHLGAALMQDMEKDTVDFVANYDETTDEPRVFPAAFPNLLVNGTTGIAVGMATNIPPHNLGEIIDAICAQVDRPEITVEELLGLVKGPDFPTGCQICGVAGIRQYAATGRGSIKVRGRTVLEETKGGREQIVITEIPFNVNRAVLVERIAALVNEKVLTDVTGVRDESDENTRVVIEIRREALPRVVVNNLYQHTALETSFAVNMLAIDRGRPKLLNLKEAIAVYIEHRREVILRRTRFLLRAAEERAETLEGYLVALATLDDVIRIIRTAASRDEARARLLEFSFDRAQVEGFGLVLHRPDEQLGAPGGRYALRERQANQILDLRLYQLTGLERDKVVEEYHATLAVIGDLRDILAREARLLELIKSELRVLREKYATPRLTEVVPDEGEIAIEDLIANEGCIITITHGGFIKRTALSVFRAQRRGGRGVIGMTTREAAREEGAADFVEHLFTASTHDYLMFFTKAGRCYVERVHQIPEMDRTAKGRAIANLLELRPEDKIAATIRVPSRLEARAPGGPADGGGGGGGDPTAGGAGGNGDGSGAPGGGDPALGGVVDRTWDPGRHVVFATRSGIVKKSSLTEFGNVRKGGIIAAKIEDGDELIDAKLTGGADELVLITREGMSLRFHESELRDQGRDTVGVWGIRPEPGDFLVALAVVEPQAMLLVVGEKGVGKRTPFDEYRLQSRGGKGIITMKTDERTGRVVGALTVTDRDELMLSTDRGQTVRIRVEEIRVTGRNAGGVKLMDLPGREKLADLAKVVSEEAAAAAGGENEGGGGDDGDGDGGAGPALEAEGAEEGPGSGLGADDGAGEVGGEAAGDPGDDPVPGAR